MDALRLLKNDHDRVDQLFVEVEAGRTSPDVLRQIKRELTVHADIEEQIFYPAVQNFPQTRDLVQEALHEHQKMREDLERIIPGAGEKAGSSELRQLIGDVRHHVQEEEDELFPRVRQVCDEQTLLNLGDRLQQAKMQFMGDLGAGGFEQPQA